MVYRELLLKGLWSVITSHSDCETKEAEGEWGTQVAQKTAEMCQTHAAGSKAGALSTTTESTVRWLLWFCHDSRPALEQILEPLGFSLFIRNQRGYFNICLILKF